MVRTMIWLAVLALVAPGAAYAKDPAAAGIDAATQAWIATMGPEATARSNAYFEGGYWIQYLGIALGIAICALLLFTGWSARVRSWLERTVKLKTLVAFGCALFFILAVSVLTFPFDYWVGFLRERQYGLSTQDFGAWFGDYLNNSIVNLVIVSVFLTIAYLIVRATKDTWWVWASGAAIACLMALVFLAPIFILPLFNTYTPMAEGPLKTDILALAQANGVPADNVYVFDASRQSHRVTANVSGIFDTTRISLADNLLNRMGPDGVRAVMAHELGHYVLAQRWSILTMTGLLVALLFACVHFAFKALAKSERWGVRGLSDPAGLPLAVGLFLVFLAIAQPLNANITRYHEMQADIFGLNAAREPDGFAKGALLLSEYRKMQPSPFEEWFFYDHPSGYARIHMAMQWKAHEMAAGHYPQGPLGPPAGYRPDFVATQGPTSP